MDHFEYITMVVSFVTAFAVSQILAGWARQWAYRETQSIYPLHTVSSILFLVPLVRSGLGVLAVMLSVTIARFGQFADPT